MVKMATFGNNKRQHQLGLTLIELLIALSIMSLGILMSTSAINARSPQLAINQAAEQLVTDLKRARLHAKQTGDSVSIIRASSGYEIPNINIQRSLGHKLVIEWSGEAMKLAFSNQFSNLGERIVISKGARRAVIIIHPITGKIERLE